MSVTKLKKTIPIVCLMALGLAGCTNEDVDVLQLTYNPTSWDVASINHEYESEPIDDIEQVLKLCSSKLEELPSGEMDVYNTIQAYKHPLSSDSYTYFHQNVTFVEQGETKYAICREHFGNNLGALKLEAFPHFVDTTSSVKIESLPRLMPATPAVDAALQRAEEVQMMDVTPIPDTSFQLTPTLTGVLDFEFKGHQSEYPIIAFNELLSKPIQFGLIYEDATQRPVLIQQFHGDQTMTSELLFKELDDSNRNWPYTTPNLTVERLPIDEQLEEGKSYPLYALTYEVDGQMTTDTLNVTYREATEELMDAETKKEFAAMREGFETFLHKRSPDEGEALSYPDIVNLSLEDATNLVEWIEAAQPTSQSGEVGAYPFLTISKNGREQTFEVSTKQRSKKLDIFLTDPKRDETFKLSSEGAELFVKLYPMIQPETEAKG